MKKNFYLSAAIFSIILLLLPAVAYGLPFPYFGTNPPLLPCTGTDCKSVCDILVLLQRIIFFGISLVTFAIAPVLIV